MSAMAVSMATHSSTQLINAIRGHLTDYGWVAPKGPSYVMLSEARLACLARTT